MLSDPQRTFTVEEERPLPGGLAKGGLEGAAHQTADEMRNGVGEEEAAEEVGNKVKPLHGWGLLLAE